MLKLISVATSALDPGFCVLDFERSKRYLDITEYTTEVLHWQNTRSRKRQSRGVVDWVFGKSCRHRRFDAFG